MIFKKGIKMKMYEFDIEFIVSSDILKSINKIYTKYKISKKETSDGFAGITIPINMKRYVIIINKEYLTFNTIFHEVYHVVSMIARDRYIVEEESIAWLQGYIGEEIVTALTAKKLI